MANRSVTVSVGGDVGDFAASMDQAAETYKEFEAVLKRGKATFDATRTPAEKYQAKIASLSDELKRGAISQDTFNRAVKQAGDSMAGSPFGKGAGQLDDFGRAAANALPSAGGLGNVLGALGPAGIAAAAGIGTVVAAGAAAVGVFEAVAGATGKALDRIDQLDDAAANIGVSTEALSALRYAAGFAGIGAEELDGSLQKMLKNVGKAAIEGGKTADTLNKMGLSATQLANMKPDEAFVKIAQSLSSIENPAQRAAAAQDIFGKSGTKMLGALANIAKNFAESKAEAEAFGVVISDIDAAKVAAANDNISRLQAVAEGAGNTLAIELAPALKAATDEVLNFIKGSGGVVDNVKFAVEVFKQYTAILLDFAPAAKAAAVAAAGLVGGAKGAAAMSALIPDVGFNNLGEKFLKFWDDANVKGEAAAKIAAQEKQNLRGIAEETEKATKAEELLNKIRQDASEIGLSDSQKKLQQLRESFGIGPLTEADAAKMDEAAKQLEALDAAKKADEAAKKSKQAEDRLKEMLDRAIKEGETAGMTDSQKKLFDLGQAGASPEQLDQAKQALEAADAAKEAAKQQQKQKQEADKLAQSAEKLKESLFDPAQKYNQTVGDANALLNEGLIDAVTHQKALAKAAADYQKQMQSAAGATGAMEKGSKEAFSFIENARRKAQAANQPLPLGPNPNMLPPPGGLPNATGPAPGGLGGKPQPNLSELSPPGRAMGGAPQPSLEELAKRVSEGSGPSIGGKPQPTLEELAKRVAQGAPPVIPDANDPAGLAKSAAAQAAQKIAEARAAGVKEGPGLGLSPQEPVSTDPVELAKKAAAEAAAKIAEARANGPKEGPGLGLSPELPDVNADPAGYAKAAAAQAAEKLAAAKAKMQPAEIPEPIAARPPQMPDIKLPDGSGVEIKETPAMANANSTSQRGTREESDTKKIVENTGKTATELSGVNKALEKIASKFEQPQVAKI